MAARRRPKIGLALGSGGARGWCHIGVLRELQDMGIRPDVVAGTSMGALVAAVHAGGALDALEDWARKLTARSFVGMLDMRLTSGGLVEGREIVELIDSLGMPKRIEDMSVPLALIATNMRTGREACLTKGPVTDAVRASVALPGIISPWYLNEDWHLDGGLTNPLPVSACRVLGAEVVLAVNPNGRTGGTFWAERGGEDNGSRRGWREYLPDLPEALRGLVWREGDEREPPRPGYLDVIAASIDIMTEEIRRSRVAADPPHVELDAHLSDMSVLDFHRAEQAIEEGRRIVREKAEALKRAAEA